MNSDRVMSDEEREVRIEHLGASMVLAQDIDERVRLWRRLKDEIAARSPAQIRRMEDERGLSR